MEVQAAFTASGGRAWRGLWPCVHEVNDSINGEQMLLRHPATTEDLLIMSSNQAAFSIAYCFSSSQESASFTKCVKDKGWSIAARLHAKLCLWGTTAQASCDMRIAREHQSSGQRQLSSMVSQACITCCIYMPLRCFQIPRHKMKLSDAALQRALEIRDRPDANAFLRSFGPFASESLYHLGGVFFSQVTVECSEQTSLVALQSQTQKEMKGGFNTNFGAIKLVSVGAGASGQKTDSRNSSSNSNSAIKVANRVEEISVLGPVYAKNDDEFREHLRKDPAHCMAIIDKAPDGRDNLVGVWDLLLQHSTQVYSQDPHMQEVKLKRAAKLLCECWLEEYATSHYKTLLSRRSTREDAECYAALMNKSEHCLAILSSDPTLLQPKLLHSQYYRAALRPLPDPPKDLSKALDQLVAAAQEDPHGTASTSDISQNVSNVLKSFLSGSSQQFSHAEDHWLSHEGLTVFRNYGFRPHTGEWVSQLNFDQLKSMIKELRKISKARGCRSQRNVQAAINWGGDRSYRSNDTYSAAAASSSQFSSSGQHEFRYFGDVVVDRNMYATPISIAGDYNLCLHAAACRLIDCLRHRLNPLKHLLQVTSPSSSSSSTDCTDECFWDSDDDSEQTIDDTQSRNQDMGLSPFELLIHIIQGSDLSTQIAICDLLLSQRSAVPLIFPAAGVERRGKVALVQYTEAMSLVKVTLDNEQKLCIAHDRSLLRVAFISNKPVADSHSAIIASRVLKCDFISQHLPEKMNQLITDEFVAVEFGIGFIPNRCATSATKLPDQDKCDHFACLAIQITGNYNRIMDFVGDTADVLILELKEGNRDTQQLLTGTPLSGVVLCWQETGGKPGSDKPNKHLWGQETYLVQRIEKFLQTQFTKKKWLNQKVTRPSISEVCNRHFDPGHKLHSVKERLERMFNICDFKDIRKKLSLQRSLIVEADTFFEGLQQHDRAKKHERDKVQKQERDKRVIHATDISSMPLIKLFHHVLTVNDASMRRFGIMWLEGAVSQKMYTVLEDASEEVDGLFLAFNKDRKDDKLKKQYFQAKQDYVNKSVGLENLWRELCHIYEADPGNQRPLARLAAQHLLDGFPLEILDGDAGMYCKLWVDTVLAELDTMTKAIKARGRSARILVLSVMGLQSSGKSTMLNLMFGTQLRTSAGRCTRGVYIQLVPSERPEYDYVLLLDTEGLRSPEFSGLEAHVVRDNRLATFGLLPSDASLFMVCNEDDGGLKEVLPMVLLAFKGSAIAEQYGQRIKAKVVFVYRSVDTNDKKKLKGNTRKLHEHLIAAAEEVARMGGIRSSSVTSWTAAADSKALLSDFQVDKSDKESDVRFLGSLKKGSKPPFDTPEWAYGESVVELREYLHSRVVTNSAGWKASSFGEWGKRLEMVWDCICTADFELSFTTRIHLASYLELLARLEEARSVVITKYMEAFRDLERRIAIMDKEESNKNHLEDSVLEADVRVVVRRQTDEVESIVAKWKGDGQRKTDEVQNWNNFCRVTRDWHRKRIKDLRSGVLEFDKVVAEYQQRFKLSLVQEIEKRQRADPSYWRFSDSERERKFEDLFKIMLDDAEKEHPPIAKEVRKKVIDMYVASNLGMVIDMNPNQGALGVGKATSTMVKNALSTILGKLGAAGPGNSTNVDHPPNKFAELELMIDRLLQDANQYSDEIVNNAIKATKEIITRKGTEQTREEQEVAHAWVMGTLIDRLKDIQMKWDKSHNVKEKLNGDGIRGELKNFFADLCKGLEATVLLVNQLQRGLETELKEAHRRAVVRYVVVQVGNQSWVKSWKMMRAILDYHLLTLMEMKSTDKLLMYATNGPLHFTTMMDALVWLAMTREMAQGEWNKLIRKVKVCLDRKDFEVSAREFLINLKRSLTDLVDGKLADAVVTSLHVIKSPKDKDEKLDPEFYEKKLPGLCGSVESMAMPDFGQIRDALIKDVMEEMSSNPDENCRPRCEASCPMCESICYLAKGHSVAKHDTIHQPGGLGGVRVHGCDTLDGESCLQRVENNANMVFKDGRRVPYSDFEIEFPAWAKPWSNDANAIQVRECLFFRYHRELADFHKSLPSQNIPVDYNHNAAHLRAQLGNTLRQKLDQFEDFDSQLLKTL